MTVVLFGVGLFANLGLALLALIMADRHRRRHLARLQRAKPQAQDAAAASPAEVTNKKTRPSQPRARVIARLEQRLTQSGLSLGVGEFLGQLGFAVLAIYAALVLILALHPLAAVPVAILVPLAIAALALRIARSRYLAAFTLGLPEALDVFARGMRAGRPVADSLAIVVESSTGPVQREFARCHDEQRMGTTLAVSLDRLSVRIPTPEVCFFAVATSLQAETGGNLIETMESLASQLRERRKLRKKARALSSEARASAVILASLPFAVAMLIGALNAAYLEPLIHDPRGRVMALTGITSIALGIFIMMRMGKLDV